MAVVEFFFAPGSRYSYLAASRMPELERDTGCRVEWIPIDGRELRALRGVDPFAGAPVSGQYEWPYRRLDAERWAACYGIPYREPPSHDVDFRLLARVAAAGRRLGAAAVVGWAMARLVYASEVWPLDAEACLAAAMRAGVDGAALRAMLGDPATDAELSAGALEAHRRGAFGVPSFFVGEAMFWGNDRLALLRHHLGAGDR